MSACPLVDSCLINTIAQFGSPGYCPDKLSACRKKIRGGGGFFFFSDCGAWASRVPQPRAQEAGALCHGLTAWAGKQLGLFPDTQGWLRVSGYLHLGIL